MSETIPRWALPEVEFVETDAERIKNEMFAAYEAFTGRTLADGDPVRLFLLSIADIIIQQRAAINFAGQQNLLSYAQGEYLDALGQFMSVSRLPASAASASFKFTLSRTLAEAYIIPAGFEITDGSITFATVADATIPAGSLTVEVSAECTEPGVSGNGYAVGTIDTIVSPVVFLASAVNTTETTGGSDAEDDASLAERIRLAPNSFSVAGPKKAYMYHAKSVNPAIIDVAVDSPSPGVVNVYPLMSDGVALTEDLIAQISEHLNDDEIRPLTDQVVVKAPTAYPYTIKVEYYINESNRANASTIRSRIEAAVESYRIWQNGKIGRDLDPEKLACLVKDAGAGQIASLTPAFDDYTVLAGDTVATCAKEDVTINFKGFKAD